MQNFPERLNDAILSARIQKSEVAARMGVALSTVSRWLGGAIPKGETLIALANCLSVDAKWLIGETDQRNPPSTVEAPSEIDTILAEGPAGAAARMTLKELLEVHSRFVQKMVREPNATMRGGFAFSIEIIAAELARRISRSSP